MHYSHHNMVSKHKMNFFYHIGAIIDHNSSLNESA